MLDAVNGSEGLNEEGNAGNADLENITVVSGSTAPDEFGSTAYSPESDEKVYGNRTAAPEPGPADEDGIIQYVSKDMLIGDIVAWYPDVSLVLMKVGMHCISCFASQMETLEQAAIVHGYDPDDVAKIVNDYLTQTKNGNEPTEE